MLQRTRSRPTHKDHEPQDRGLDTAVGSTSEWNQSTSNAGGKCGFFSFHHDERSIGRHARQILCIAPFVNHRNELTYLLAKLIGRVEQRPYLRRRRKSAPKLHASSLALLGAECLATSATHAYRNRTHFAGRKLGQENRSRSQMCGVDVKPGDYILCDQQHSSLLVTQSLRALIGTQTNKWSCA